MSIPTGYSASTSGVGDQYFERFARMCYYGNPLVNTGFNIRANACGEPEIVGSRYRRNSPQIRAAIENATRPLAETREAHERKAAAEFVRSFENDLRIRGFTAKAIRRAVVVNGFVEQVNNHPLVRMLNNPNPKRSRGQLWGTVCRDRDLSGNAYLLKARNVLNGVQELWRLAPHRVRILGDGSYQYTVGRDVTIYPAEDVLHFRTDEVLDDWYGVPPLLSVWQDVISDNHMSAFLRTFFENGGTGPGAILTTKNGLDEDAKAEIRERKRRLLGGQGGWFEWLILDANESTFQQLGLDRGLRDAMPKEINARLEARITMITGVPGSIIGSLIGYESSSYANKRQDWQVLWDITMAPLLDGFDDVLNLGLAPEFAGIDAVEFDLQNVPALQEDQASLEERASKLWQVGLSTWEEARAAVGLDPGVTDGVVMVPSNTEVKRVDTLGEEPAQPQITPPLDQTALGQAMRDAFAPGVIDVTPSRVGRPGLLADPGARATYDRAVALRARNPSWSWLQVADKLGISERQLRRYRGQFGVK